MNQNTANLSNLNSFCSSANNINGASQLAISNKNFQSRKPNQAHKDHFLSPDTAAVVAVAAVGVALRCAKVLLEAEPRWEYQAHQFPAKRYFSS